jgi:hypothetical protein
MDKIVSMTKLGSLLTLGALSLALGCERVALLPRGDVDGGGYSDRRADERRDSDRVERDARRNEVFGRIQDVDERRREIRVRTDDGGTSIVRYDGSTRISDGTRELRPDSLRSGDEISVRLGRSGAGEQYADAIRVIDQRSGSRR